MVPLRPEDIATLKGTPGRTWRVVVISHERPNVVEAVIEPAGEAWGRARRTVPLADLQLAPVDLEDFGV